MANDEIEAYVDGYPVRTRNDGPATVPYKVGIWHSAWVLVGYAPRVAEIAKAEAALKHIVHGLLDSDKRGARLEIGDTRVQVVGDQVAVCAMFRTERYACGCYQSGPCSHGSRRT